MELTAQLARQPRAVTPTSLSQSRIFICKISRFASLSKGTAVAGRAAARAFASLVDICSPSRPINGLDDSRTKVFNPSYSTRERKSGLGSLVWSMTGAPFALDRVPRGRFFQEGRSQVSGISSPWGPRPRNPFWRKRTRLPGTVKQVRGAQYPPLTGDGQVPVMLEPAKLRSQSSAGSADTGLSGGGSTRAGGAGGTAVGAPRPPRDTRPLWRAGPGSSLWMGV